MIYLYERGGEREEREIDRGRERVTEELIIVHSLHNSSPPPRFVETEFNDSGCPQSQSPHSWPLLRFPELFFPQWSLAFPVPVNLLSQLSVLMAYLEILVEVLESGRWSFSVFLPP